MYFSPLVRFFLAVFLISTLTAGCATPSRYLSESDPLLFPHCLSSSSGQDARFSSMAAMTLALKNRKWVVTRIDADQGVIEAEIWRFKDGQKYFDTVIRAAVDQAGAVSITRLKPEVLAGEHLELLQRWVELLDKPYRSYSCRSVAELQGLLAEEGFRDSLRPAK
jgi:hypothetical protein